MSVGAGPPDCRQTMRAKDGSAAFNARISSENWPLDCRANTAPKLPQQSASWVPVHFTHMLMVPAVAALSPPPPATLTYCDPLNASAPPATPFRSVVPLITPTNVPFTPRVA